MFEEYDDIFPVNIGTGILTTIRELSEMVKKTVGYEGKIIFDSARPDGMPRRKLDRCRIDEMGIRPSTLLKEGLKKSCDWYLMKLKEGNRAEKMK